MNFVKSVIVVSMFAVSIVGNVLAQEIINAPNVIKEYKGSNSGDPQDRSGAEQQWVRSEEEQVIINEMKVMKASGNPAFRERFLELQRRLERINGREVTKPAERYDGGVAAISEENPDPMTITNVRVRSTGSSVVKGLATVTEKLGTTAGRIWLVVAYGQLANVRDSLYVYRSDNHGATWTPYALAWLGGTDKINYDDIDMELIENSTGEKYLYVVYGIRADGGTGRWFAGGLVLQTPTFAGSLFAFSWPGDDPTKRYYRPRITSDNALYPSIAYLYIVCSFDSAVGTSRHNYQVYTRCLNPYTVSPSFTYMTGKFFWHTTTPTQRDLHSDIAYFQNGNDSVITVYSNVPDTNSLFFAKADIFGGPGGNVAAGGFIGGSEPNDWKQFARISSNSNANGSVICVFRQLTSGNWNVKYFRTTNFGNFNTIAGQSILWGSSANPNYQPDIVGERNSSVHYFAFNTIASQDSAHYVKVTSGGITTHIRQMNSLRYISGIQGPKPGIRHVAGDSCLVLYSASGPFDAWVAYGCSPPIVTQLDTLLVIYPDSTTGTATNQAYKRADRDTTNLYLAQYYTGPVRRVYIDTSGAALPNLENYRTILYVESSFDALVSRYLGVAARTALKNWLNAGGPTDKRKLAMIGADLGYNYSRTGSAALDTTLAHQMLRFVYRLDNANLQGSITGEAVNTGQVFAYNTGVGGFWPDGCLPRTAAGVSVLYRYTGRTANDSVAGIGYNTTGYISACLFQDPRYFSGTFGPVLRSLLQYSTITDVRNLSVEVPGDFALMQNFPNPFNPVTSIRFSIPRQVNVSLKIYDILGREVTTLVNEVKQAGTYEITWDASSVASGVYFYRFIAGEFRDVRKMMVLK